MEHGIQSYLKSKKPLIEERMREIVSLKKKAIGDSSLLAQDALERFGEFSLGGKNVRGSLVLLGAEMFGLKDNEGILDAACSLEFLHSSLLIHDDLMDKDLLRRGKPTIYVQYEKFLDANKKTKQLFSAKSLAVCLGDLGFFLGMDALWSSALKPESKNEAARRITQSLETVGLAQMDDVYFSSRSVDPTEEEIEKIYLNKTARYTISLPLAMGAVCAGAPQKDIKLLEKTGEHLGLVYQLKDDEMGIFSVTEKLGKPVGSDIRENKKTYLRRFLFENASASDRLKLEKIFGCEKISETDLEKVRLMIKKYGVLEKTGKIQESHLRNANETIALLKAKKQFKELLFDLARYMALREK